MKIAKIKCVLMVNLLVVLESIDATIVPTLDDVMEWFEHGA